MNELEQKSCQRCGKVFDRRPAPLDSAFRWMRRKYCSTECARSASNYHPSHPDLSGPAQNVAPGERRGDRRTPATATRVLIGSVPSVTPDPGPGLGALPEHPRPAASRPGAGR